MTTASYALGLPRSAPSRGGDCHAHDLRRDRGVHDQHRFVTTSDCQISNGMLRLTVGAPGAVPSLTVEAWRGRVTIDDTYEDLYVDLYGGTVATPAWLPMGTLTIDSPSVSALLTDVRIAHINDESVTLRLVAPLMGDAWVTLRRGERQVRIQHGSTRPPVVDIDRRIRWTHSLSYADLIVADGAVAAWPMEETAGAVYADVIGNLDATLNRGITSDYASTPIGPSIAASPSFSWTGDYLTSVVATTTHGATLEVGTGDFALEAWTKLAFDVETSAVWPIGLVRPDFAGYVVGEFLGPNHPSPENTGAVAMEDYNEYLLGPTGYDDDRPHHCIFTRRSGTYFVIVDGIEVATLTPASPMGLSTTERINLAGADYGAIIPDYVFYPLVGQMAWAAFYPVGLSTAQAAAHYVAGASPVGSQVGARVEEATPATQHMRRYLGSLNPVTVDAGAFSLVVSSVTTADFGAGVAGYALGDRSLDMHRQLRDASRPSLVVV